MANPAVPTTTGDFYFAVNHRGLIHYTAGRLIPLNSTTCIMAPDLLPFNNP